MRFVGRNSSFFCACKLSGTILVSVNTPRSTSLRSSGQGWLGSLVWSPAAVGGSYVYRCAVTGQRPATDYTPRVIPRFDGVAVPLEASRILWQR